MPEPGEFSTDLLLSGSTNGRPITVAATAIGSATTIHQATSTSGEVDVVTLYANNTHSSAVVLHVVAAASAGGGSDPGDIVAGPILLGVNLGPALIMDALPFDNGVYIQAYADTASEVTITGQKATLTK